jgi:hypothetical protein
MKIYLVLDKPYRRHSNFEHYVVPEKVAVNICLVEMKQKFASVQFKPLLANKFDAIQGKPSGTYSSDM